MSLIYTSMHYLYLSFLAFTGLFFISGASGCNNCCGPCEEVSCADYLSVRFLSKTDSADLFSNGTYDGRNLKLLGMSGDGKVTDHTFGLTEKFHSEGNKYFFFQVTSDVTGYIFQYNPVERDTLLMQYAVSSTDCCDVLTNFTFGVFNGDTVTRDAGGYLILTK